MSNIVGLLALTRSLSPNRSERRLILSTLITLIRSRRHYLFVLFPLFLFAPPISSKLILWSVIARSLHRRDTQRLLKSNSLSLYSSILHTHAYSSSFKSIKFSRSGLHLRIPSWQSLVSNLVYLSPTKILLFHHYDSTGFLPSTWFNFLTFAQKSGWQVLVTTSYMKDDFCRDLNNSGVLVVQRANVGLCLGAYRDISVLIGSIPKLMDCISSLVFLNDSCLLLKSPESMLADIEYFHSIYHNTASTLAGLTDSFERSQYHLQSYFLYANKLLINDNSWFHFWLNFDLDCSKDLLILHGEIGLSQYLLSCGVSLQASYPLVPTLLKNSRVHTEFTINKVSHLNEVNQTLDSWRSLLSRGFPFLKKSLLFNADHSSGSINIFSDLLEFASPECLDLLSSDINSLTISRFSTASSDHS